jgi:hypothetical protein
MRSIAPLQRSRSKERGTQTSWRKGPVSERPSWRAGLEIITNNNNTRGKVIVVWGFRSGWPFGNAFISYRTETVMSTTTQVSSESRSKYKAKAYSAASAKSPLVPTTIPRRDPGEDDVQIEILFCGICHSDLHQIRNEWSRMPTVYPCVPGHEIVGRVTKLLGRETNNVHSILTHRQLASLAPPITNLLVMLSFSLDGFILVNPRP